MLLIGPTVSGGLTTSHHTGGSEPGYIPLPRRHLFSRREVSQAASRGSQGGCPHLTAVCVSIEPPVRWRAYRFAPSGPMSCSLHRQPHSTSGLNLYEYRCKKFGIRAEVLAAGK